MADFGLAALCRPTEAAPPSSANAASLANAAYTLGAGTLRYMAPETIRPMLAEVRAEMGTAPSERRRGGHYSLECDVYSFGLLLWEMMHGEIVFKGVASVQVAKGVATRDERPALALPAPRACFGPLIDLCSRLDATERPTMAECAEQLNLLCRQPELRATMELPRWAVGQHERARAIGPPSASSYSVGGDCHVDLSGGAGLSTVSAVAFDGGVIEMAEVHTAKIGDCYFIPCDGGASPVPRGAARPPSHEPSHDSHSGSFRAVEMAAAMAAEDASEGVATSHSAAADAARGAEVGAEELSCAGSMLADWRAIGAERIGSDGGGPSIDSFAADRSESAHPFLHPELGVRASEWARGAGPALGPALTANHVPSEAATRVPSEAATRVPSEAASYGTCEEMGRALGDPPPANFSSSPPSNCF